MSRLGDEIRQLIALEGPISVERYMALALGHPRHGYYRTRDPLGARGDFITAPEISQMFGELLGLWAAQCWLDLGKPERLRLVECGPGRGTLLVDALRAARSVPDFREALSLELIEISPVLKAAQLRSLSNCGVPVAWRNHLGEIEAGLPLIVIGNEFLDALPLCQYVRQNGAWHERLVGVVDEALVFGLAREAEASLYQQAPEGAVLEVAFQARTFIRDLAQRLKTDGGVALFVDYGHAKSGFGETLQAVHNHRFVDPLSEPGEADLTAHVDFAALLGVAREAGIDTYGPVEQGPFLKSLGLEERADQLIRAAPSEAQQKDIRSAERRLCDMARTGMGQMFKAVGFAGPGQPIPAPFDDPRQTG